MIHWQVKFKSLRTDTLYTVSVYDDSYTGSPVQLKGAAQPFVTQEDTSDDMFFPVRTQSGYLRIKDDGKDASGNTLSAADNWRAMIPTTDTDRPVVLTDEVGNIMWQGFLQAQNFGSRLYEMPQDREFPLQCPLTVTSRKDVDPYQSAVKNFAFLLVQILNSIPLVCRPTSVIIQGQMSWLLTRLDWQNFISLNDDMDQVRSGYKMFNLLEKMCRYWGWTARVDKGSLYLLCVDDAATAVEHLYILTSAQLTQLANGTLPSISPDNYLTATFGNDIYANTNNNDLQMRGPNRACVTSNANGADEEIISLYPQDVTKDMSELGIYSQTADDVRGLFTNDMSSFDSPLLLGTAATDVSFNLCRITGTGLDSAIEGTDYSMVRVKPSYTAGVALASFETRYEHNFYAAPISGFSWGGIQLTGKIFVRLKEYDYADSSGVGRSTLHLRVGIGPSRSSALWWDGSQWSNSLSEFTVIIGGNKGELRAGLKTNNSALTGKLFVDILGSNDMWHPPGPDSGAFYDRFDLADLKVTFQKSMHGGISSVFDTFEWKEQKKYTASAEAMVQNSWDASTIFATENYMTWGYGVVMNTDGTYFTGFDYGDGHGVTQPEKHLANRVVDYWSTSKRKIECEIIAGTTIDITPQVKGTIDGTELYPVSISRDWRDDVVKLVMMEI